MLPCGTAVQRGRVCLEFYHEIVGSASYGAGISGGGGGGVWQPAKKPNVTAKMENKSTFALVLLMFLILCDFILHLFSILVIGF